MAGIEAQPDAQQGRADIDDDRLAEAADRRGERLADDQGAARGRADHVAVQYAKVALPDRRKAVEDRHEQDALGEHAGRQEVDVGAARARQSAHVGHDLAEQHQPQDRLHRAADEVHGVVPQLQDLGVGHRHHLGGVAGGRGPRDRAGGMGR